MFQDSSTISTFQSIVLTGCALLACKAYTKIREKLDTISSQISDLKLIINKTRDIGSNTDHPGELLIEESELDFPETSTPLPIEQNTTPAHYRATTDISGILLRDVHKR